MVSKVKHFDDCYMQYILHFECYQIFYIKTYLNKLALFFYFFPFLGAK